MFDPKIDAHLTIWHLSPPRKLVYVPAMEDIDENRNSTSGTQAGRHKHPGEAPAAFFEFQILSMKLLLLSLALCLAQPLQAVSLTFEVDMQSLIEQGGFDPASEFVDLAGTFNQWGSTLTMLDDPDGDSIYSTTLSGFTAGSSIAFKFRINGLWDGREEFPGAGNDRSLTVPEGDSTFHFVYNQYIFDYDPAQQDTSELAWWNDAVFYEIFVRSFYDSDGDGIGDFRGLTQQLDYLNDGDPSTTDDLGVTGLWLMPIHPSPSYHGYDVTDYRAINPDYGSMADFEAFLDSAHARGIRVIIDLVINHSSTQHPWFVDARSGPNASYRDWYRWSDTPPGYQGPWGQNVWHNSSSGFYYGVFWDQMPDLNYENPEVRQEIFDLADYWLEEVGIDGFRIDAVKYLYEDGAQLENLSATFDFFRDFRAHYQTVKPKAFAVGEAWTNTAQVLDYVREDRLDYCFEFDLAGQMIYAVQSADASNLRNQLDFVYQSYPYLQWGSFLTNHDQDRVIDVLGNDLAQNKVAASLYLTLPGVPYLYYGEEVGMNGTKPDPDIRRPMQWSAGSNGGFSNGNPWRSLNGNYATRNVATMQQQSGSLWHHYRDLIDLRNQSVALRRGYLETPVSNQASIFAALRYWQDDTVLVLINLDDQASASVTLSRLGLASGDKLAFDGLSGETRTLSVTDGELNHPPLVGHETRVYRLDGTFTVSNSAAEPRSVQVYPNPSQGQITVVWPQASAQTLTYRLFDSQGRRVAAGSLPQTSAKFTLSLTEIPTGLYLLHLRQGDHEHRVKLRLE